MTTTLSPATPAIAIDLDTLSPKRRESLELAAAAGASENILNRLASANRVSRKPSILLPRHRFAYLSRGRDWCRRGKGATARWGEEEDGGWRVSTPGRWIVGGNDGFSRKGEVCWDVESVPIGDETWFLAN